ncbi:SDR family NAD(P)-dependent oxidoreductase [Nocardia mangyaensis]|uniref:SDR family NAD(P)-dependent oxidoreductase n=1 Tax=Nocardia mangyaensis TaxID=2213200 RepID=UPI003F585137
MTGDRCAALVIGGASGIGLATVRALAAEGYRVTIADIDEAGARDAAASLGGDVTATGMDVTDEDSVAAGFESAHGVHSVVNCAGLSIPGAITELDLAHWQTTIDVCLTGTFLVLKHAPGTGDGGEPGAAVVSLLHRLSPPRSHRVSESAQCARHEVVDRGGAAREHRVDHPVAARSGSGCAATEYDYQRCMDQGRHVVVPTLLRVVAGDAVPGEFPVTVGDDGALASATVLDRVPVRRCKPAIWSLCAVGARSSTRIRCRIPRRAWRDSAAPGSAASPPPWNTGLGSCWTGPVSLPVSPGSGGSIVAPNASSTIHGAATAKYSAAFRRGTRLQWRFTKDVACPAAWVIVLRRGPTARSVPDCRRPAW